MDGLNEDLFVFAVAGFFDLRSLQAFAAVSKKWRKVVIKFITEVKLFARSCRQRLVSWKCDLPLVEHMFLPSAIFSPQRDSRPFLQLLDLFCKVEGGEGRQQSFEYVVETYVASFCFRRWPLLTLAPAPWQKEELESIFGCDEDLEKKQSYEKLFAFAKAWGFSAETSLHWLLARREQNMSPRAADFMTRQFVAAGHVFGRDMLLFLCQSVVGAMCARKLHHQRTKEGVKKKLFSLQDTLGAKVQTGAGRGNGFSRRCRQELLYIYFALTRASDERRVSSRDTFSSSSSGGAREQGGGAIPVPAKGASNPLPLSPPGKRRRLSPSLNNKYLGEDTVEQLWARLDSRNLFTQNFLLRSVAALFVEKEFSSYRLDTNQFTWLPQRLLYTRVREQTARGCNKSHSSLPPGRQFFHYSLLPKSCGCVRADYLEDHSARLRGLDRPLQLKENVETAEPVFRAKKLVPLHELEVTVDDVHEFSSRAKTYMKRILGENNIKMTMAQLADGLLTKIFTGECSLDCHEISRQAKSCCSVPVPASTVAVQVRAALEVIQQSGYMYLGSPRASSFSSPKGLAGAGIRLELLSFSREKDGGSAAQSGKATVAVPVSCWPEPEGRRAAHQIAALHRRRGGEPAVGFEPGGGTSLSRRVEQVLRFYLIKKALRALLQITRGRIHRFQILPPATGRKGCNDEAKAAPQIRTPAPLDKMAARLQSAEFVKHMQRTLRHRSPSFALLECFLICTTNNLLLNCERPTDSVAEDGLWLDHFIQSEKERCFPPDAQPAVTMEQYTNQLLHAKRIFNFFSLENGEYRIRAILSFFSKFLHFHEQVLGLKKAFCDEMAAELGKAAPGVQGGPQLAHDLLDQMYATEWIPRPLSDFFS
jgi:hypothetical protein